MYSVSCYVFSKRMCSHSSRQLLLARLRLSLRDVTQRNHAPNSSIHTALTELIIACQIDRSDTRLRSMHRAVIAAGTANMQTPLAPMPTAYITWQETEVLSQRLRNRRTSEKITNGTYNSNTYIDVGGLWSSNAFRPRLIHYMSVISLLVQWLS